jgi:hypothetical protein
MKPGTLWFLIACTRQEFQEEGERPSSQLSTVALRRNERVDINCCGLISKSLHDRELFAPDVGCAIAGH